MIAKALLVFRAAFVMLCAGLLAGCQQATGGPAAGVVGPGTLNVADAALAGGDPDLALSITQSVLAADPGNTAALVHEGDAYYGLGRCPAATAAYQLALKGDAKSAAAETGLGRCLLKTDVKSAETALLLAVQNDPGSADAYNDLGIALDLQSNFPAAAIAYGHALNADPEMTAAEINLGLSLALSGNGPAALQYLGPLAAGQGATPKIRADYAAALIASGRDREARAVLAIDLPPDQVNAAVAGFNDVIAGDQLALTADTPPPPTVSTAPTGVVTTIALPPPRPLSMATPRAAGPFAVQLAALDTADAARRDWIRIAGMKPRLFTDRQPRIESAVVDNRLFYRLRTGDFAREADATAFCDKVMALGCPCVVADF